MRQNGGLTRLEMVVVLVVVSMTLLLLGRAIAKTQAESDREKCESNLRTIGVALGSYAYKNADVMPQTLPFHIEGWNAGGTPAKPSPALLTWCEALVIDGDIVQQTNKNGAMNDNSTWHYPACGYGVFGCPTNYKVIQGGAVHGRIAEGYGLAWCATSNFATSWPGKPRKVLALASKLVPGHIVATDGYIAMGMTAAFAKPANDPKFGGYGVYERHEIDGMKGANYLFADGHVEWSDTYGSVRSPAYYGADASRSVPPIWVHP